ncbi:MAG: MFS transporter [Hyphomicrobiaceae bacterium]
MKRFSAVRPGIVTAICFVMAILAWGTVFYGHSVYMDALMRAHGWSSSLISSAVLVFWLASLPGTLSVGVLVDRYGPPVVVAIGGLCIGGGLLGLAWLNQPWHLFAIYAAMGFGYPALAGAAISATLAPWYDRGFGVALGIALTGASVGGALIPAFTIQYAAVHGFDAAMITVASALLATSSFAVVGLTILGRPKGATGEDRLGEPFAMRSVLSRADFWRISIAAAFGLGGQVGFLAHQVPIIAVEIGQVAAALMVTVVAIASAVGRLAVGLMSRYLTVTVLAALSYILYGVGIALLAIADNLATIAIACAVAGFVVGAIVMLPPILVREAFGTKGYGRTYAMVNVIMYVFAGLSPWLVGLIRDWTGAYSPALWMLVGLEVVAAFLILAGRPRPKG